MERIQKRIAQSGLCSRRRAEKLILEGRVKVNGETIKTLGTKAEQSDVITVDNKPIRIEEKEYYVFYKPKGVISTTDDEKDRKIVLDFVDTSARIFPVGRLDFDTTGVMLLTNDGDFTQKMIHPKHEIEKEYQVTVEGFLRKATSKKIEKGLFIEGKKTAPAKISQVTYNKTKEKTRLHFIVTEGKYHHIKKVFEQMGHPVIKLKRIRFGIVTLDGLKEGEVRILKPHEIKQLHVLAQKHQTQSK